MKQARCVFDMQLDAGAYRTASRVNVLYQERRTAAPRIVNIMQTI